VYAKAVSMRVRESETKKKKTKKLKKTNRARGVAAVNQCCPPQQNVKRTLEKDLIGDKKGP
jgi:hypothetical protein